VLGGDVYIGDGIAGLGYSFSVEPHGLEVEGEGLGRIRARRPRLCRYRRDRLSMTIG